MFTRSTFAFLRDLAEHNDTTWFHTHRDRYLKHVREPAFGLIEAWAPRLAPDYIGHPRPIGGALSPPNRDIRFGQDKTPYRTHVAIRMRHRLLLPGAPGPTFLLWVAPQGSFLSAGVHRFSGESARRIRTAILDDPEGWAAVRGLGALDDHDLAARPPPGVPDDHPLADDLRRRHYTATVPLSQKEVCDPDRIFEASDRLRPFADFTAQALYRPAPPAP